MRSTDNTIKIKGENGKFHGFYRFYLLHLTEHHFSLLILLGTHYEWIWHNAAATDTNV